MTTDKPEQVPVAEQAEDPHSDKVQPPATDKAVADGDAIAEIGDKVGGPA